MLCKLHYTHPSQREFGPPVFCRTTMIPHLFTHALHAFRASPLHSSVVSFSWRWLERRKPKCSTKQWRDFKTKTNDRVVATVRKGFLGQFKINCTYVKKAYVRIVKMHPKIDRPHPMQVIIDSGSLCSSLGWRKSKHSIVKLSVDVTTNLTDLSMLSNYHQARVRCRRNLTSVSTPKQRRNPCIGLQGQQIKCFAFCFNLIGNLAMTFLTRHVLKSWYTAGGLELEDFVADSQTDLTRV